MGHQKLSKYHQFARVMAKFGHVWIWVWYADLWSLKMCIGQLISQKVSSQKLSFKFNLFFAHFLRLCIKQFYCKISGM